ncbi:MAG: TIGR02266 family protein [Myxococcales bacterium]|nr:TIGR02266 family protein [Myxococcales bacterium]
MSDSKLVPLRIRLPYRTEEEFIEKYGSNVARGGVFIATRAIKPEGTAIAFEFVLDDGTRLMRGEGVVQKTQVDEGGTRSGMTLRFSRLDSRTKALLDRVVASRSGAPPGPPPEPEQEPAPPPEEKAEPSPPKPGRRRLPDFPTASARQAQNGAEVVLGIDMGTTNSRVAVFQEGRPVLVPLGKDGRTFGIPSVVALDEKGRFVVGGRAKAQLLADPVNTVFGAKRLLGRRARSRKVQELAMRFPYRIVADPEGDTGVELRDRTYGICELCALLLKELKEAAQEVLGQQLARAVLCVPAYFNDHQRGAMLEAGRIAGLEVERILNEPSAVALAFGYGRGLARKRILVYDLGGGTFDASVLELTGDDLEVVTTGGENFLGGLDFDTRVAEQLSLCLSQAERAKIQESLIAAQRIRDAAEQAKIALSELETTTVHLPFAAARDDGSPVDLHTELTRGTLEEVTLDLVERTVEVTEAVLEAGGLPPSALDEVLLVGGQSRAPLVRKRVEEYLKRPIRFDVDAHAAVALGAAILGHSLVQREKGKAGVSLSEVLSAPIGIGVRGGGMRRVLERNTRLPAEKAIALPLKAGQSLSVAVYQGPSAMAEENEYLGSLQLVAQKSGELSLSFAVSPDGRLEVSGADHSGRSSTVRLATADASDEVRAALLAEAPLPGEESAEGGGLLRGIRRLFGGS